MRTALIKAPLFGAIAFAIPTSIASMFRPDSIYIPVVFEALYFALGYAIFGVLNAVLIAPLFWALAPLLSTLALRLGFAAIVSAFITVIVAAAGVLGSNSSGLLFGAFAPLLATTVATVYFVTRDRNRAG